MSESSSARKAQEVAEKILGAMESALQEAVGTDRQLTDPEFFALKTAFVAAKPYLSKDFIRSFARRTFAILDMEQIRSEHGEYFDTYESFVEELIP